MLHKFESSSDSGLVFQISAFMLSGPGVLFLVSNSRHALSSSSVKSSVLIGSSIDRSYNLSVGNLWWLAKVGEMLFPHPFLSVLLFAFKTAFLVPFLSTTCYAFFAYCSLWALYLLCPWCVDVFPVNLIHIFLAVL